MLKVALNTTTITIFFFLISFLVSFVNHVWSCFRIVTNSLGIVASASFKIHLSISSVENTAFQSVCVNTRLYSSKSAWSYSKILRFICNPTQVCYKFILLPWRLKLSTLYWIHTYPSNEHVRKVHLDSHQNIFQSFFFHMQFKDTVNMITQISSLNQMEF